MISNPDSEIAQNSDILVALLNYQVDPPVNDLNEITDMEAFLDCIDTTQNATLTIYADQPVAGSTVPVSTSADVGHAFVSIEQNGNTVVFGFYPKQRVKASVAAGL